MSITEQVFEALRGNLLAHRPELSGEDVVLCPICLRKVPRAQFLAGGLEHILPRTVIKQDGPYRPSLGTINQRCGVTLLCRQPRAWGKDGFKSPDGCNGLKGKLYDRLWRDLLDDAPHPDADLRHRHGVAILMMAYLGTFQYFGYDYILRAELDEIRAQFDNPDDRVTNWLDRATYNSKGPNLAVVTASGSPFFVGGIRAKDAPLHVLFRRFSAYLPRGHWECRGLPGIPLLRPDVPKIGQANTADNEDG